jgi:lipopolysaccharide export LptBFGC system permease protein LptF
MHSTAMAPGKQRSTISIVFTSTVRVLFTTLLFTAAGMGAGLFCGIVGTVIYGIIRGTQVDMTNAYKHVAIPAAIVIGSAAFIGALVLEVRAHRQRTSR